MSESKTKILNLNLDTLQYLGFNFTFHTRSLTRNKASKNKSVLVIKPTRKAVSKIKYNMKSIFKLNMSLEGIINKLNPVVRE
jgi:hypothetical protein